MKLTNKLKFINLCALAVVTILFAGCAPKRPVEMPTTYPLCIMVKGAGVPVSGIEVTLTPEKAQGNLTINGTTDASGSAVIRTTYNDYAENGAPEGAYKVLLSAKSTALSPAFADARETPFSVVVEQGAKAVEIEVADAD